MQKGFTAIINSALGIAVLIILMATVVIPQIYAPISPSMTQTAYTNSTTVMANATGREAQTFILVNPDRTTTTATLTVAYQFNGTPAGSLVNLTTKAGTFIASLDGTTPDTINLAQATYLTNGVNMFNWTSDTTYKGTNITSAVLSYHTQATSTTQGWDAQTLVLWTVLAIGCVVAVLIYVFKMAG